MKSNKASILRLEGDPSPAGRANIALIMLLERKGLLPVVK